MSEGNTRREHVRQILSNFAARCYELEEGIERDVASGAAEDLERATDAIEALFKDEP